MRDDDAKKAIEDRYTSLARGIKSSCCEPQCCGDYPDEELLGSPGEAAEVSAGCGNPTAHAEIKSGMTVVDLGSGGGMDAFLAARKTGPTGRVIGVDATPEMIRRARETSRKHGFENTEFRLGEIEHLPVESGVADLVISNCVINLSTDKPRVSREAHRVLKPGGQLLVSDIVTLHEMPREIKDSPIQWAQCLAGAIPEEEFLQGLERAGFEDPTVVERQVYTAEHIRGFIEDDDIDPGVADQADGVFASSTITARK